MIARPCSTADETAFNLGWIWTISLVAALGGLLFGYDWVVIGGAKPFYENYFHLTTPLEVGWAMSSALIGCLGGAILSGRLADRFGRKRLLILAASDLHALVDRHGPGRIVHDLRAQSACRRSGDRPGVEPVADVHRRDRPGPDARQAGVDQPAHHRHRHLAGPGDQLADRRAGHAGRRRPSRSSLRGTARSAGGGCSA